MRLRSSKGRRTRRWLPAAASLALAIGAMTLPREAAADLVITPTFDGSITDRPDAAAIENAINQAIQFYESNISTPITVAITFANMNSGLGQSSTYVGTTSYNTYLAALQSHAASLDDGTALATLPAGPNNPVNGNTNIELTTANFRALGINVNPPAGQPDSTISVNFDQTNIPGGIASPSKYGLNAVLQHEIDEALGLGSGLDSGNTTGVIRPVDLFRYSATTTRSYTLSTTATPYFSIDGGLTPLVNFNQSGPPGGADYGDWARSGTARVQDAFGTPGADPFLTTASPEFRALDVIGYNGQSPISAVPEPSVWALACAGGLVLAGGRLARRRLAKAEA